MYSAGSPTAEVGSVERDNYEKGVRMGSYAMIVYSATACFYSFTTSYLIEKIGE